MKQKALLVHHQPGRTDGIEELNVQLGRGWRVVEVSPLGGAGVGVREEGTPELCLAALVIIERSDEEASDVMARAEEETEELVEEIVEGEELSEEQLSEELEEERNGGRSQGRFSPSDQ